MRKSLNVDCIRKKIIEGEHIRQGRASTIQDCSHRLNRWASLFMGSFASIFIAEGPNDDGRVVSVAFDEVHHVLNICGIIGK
jgi:hypothetical protein